MVHRSVLLKEVVRWLDPKPGQVIVDGTIGLGGHAAEILKRNSPDGRLIGFDRDPEALEAARERLAEFGDRLMLIHDNFANMVNRLREKRVPEIHGALLDLGVSSMQLDSTDRGFSFQSEGPLDMRMDRRTQTLTARQIVNDYSQGALEKVLWDLGQERFARRIARAIVAERSLRRIETTAGLASLISRVVPPVYRHGRIHPATRSFQALRLELNQEFGSLENFLKTLPQMLASSSRCVIVSFHSLEDRLVKQAFRRVEAEGRGRILTKKPISARDEEILENPRSRSAKMRVLERVG